MEQFLRESVSYKEAGLPTIRARVMVVSMLWKYALCAFMHELMGSHNNLLAMGFFKPLWAWTYHLSLGPMGQYMASQWTLKISILMRVNLSPFVVTFKRKF